MTDKNFTFSKTLWDLINNSEYNNSDPIQFSTNGELYLSISMWEDVPTLTKTAIIAQATSFGWIEN